MKYQKWYNRLIEHRVANEPNTSYHEKHHIVPKSIGGSNDSSNIVKLTAREHFIAHLLLSKMYPPKSREWVKMSYALNRLKHDPKRYKITSRRYEQIRIHHAKTLSATKGSFKWITNGVESRFIANYPTVLENGWRYGKTFSKDHAEKLDKFRRTRDASVAITAMREASLGKTVSKETREKIRQGNLGKTLSEETRHKMSISQKARFSKQ